MHHYSDQRKSICRLLSLPSQSICRTSHRSGSRECIKVGLDAHTAAPSQLRLRRAGCIAPWLTNKNLLANAVVPSRPIKAALPLLTGILCLSSSAQFVSDAQARILENSWGGVYASISVIIGMIRSDFACTHHRNFPWFSKASRRPQNGVLSNFISKASIEHSDPTLYGAIQGKSEPYFHSPSALVGTRYDCRVGLSRPS